MSDAFFDWKTKKVVEVKEPPIFEVPTAATVAKREAEGYYIVTDSDLLCGGEYDYGK